MKPPLAVALLFVVAYVRFGLLFTWPTVTPDEAAFVEGFRSLLEGRTPYEHARFLYSPLFAHAGAWGLAHVGLTHTLALLRAANVAGVVVVAWIASGAVARPMPRLIGACALVALAPPLVVGAEMGNPSPAVAALVLVGLRYARISWALAGAALGCSLAWKPLGLLAIVLMSTVPATRRAAILGLAFGALAYAFDPEATRALVTRGDASFRGVASGSLYHSLQVAGLRLPSPLIALAVAVSSFLVVRRAGSERLAVVAPTATILASPMVWTHTFALVLPLVVAVVVRSASDRGSAEGRLRFVLALLGATTLFTAHVWRGFVELPGVVQALLTAIPLLALLGLTQSALRGDARKFGHLTAL